MNPENELSRLVAELHLSLREGLASIRNKPSDPAHGYILHTASGLEQAVDGYVLLTSANKIHAAQLVVRTCLESFFRIQAVCAKPELLFGIALHEHKEDLKLLKAAKVKGHDFIGESEARWESLRQSLIAHFRATGIKDHPLDAYGAAAAGDLASVYEFQYRFFCNFTHASLRSIIGNIANLYSLSDRSILLCLVGALGAVNQIGGCITDLHDKVERAKTALGKDPFG